MACGKGKPGFYTAKSAKWPRLFMPPLPWRRRQDFGCGAPAAPFERLEPPRAMLKALCGRGWPWRHRVHVLFAAQLMSRALREIIRRRADVRLICRLGPASGRDEVGHLATLTVCRKPVGHPASRRGERICSAHMESMQRVLVLDRDTAILLGKSRIAQYMLLLGVTWWAGCPSDPPQYQLQPCGRRHVGGSRPSGEMRLPGLRPRRSGCTPLLHWRARGCLGVVDVTEIPAIEHAQDSSPRLHDCERPIPGPFGG